MNPLFPSDNTRPVSRKRAMPTAATDRYNKTLDFIRSVLKFNAEVELQSTALNQQFGVSTSFLTALFKLNAVTRRRKQGKSYYYKALPKLETVTAQNISEELAKANKKDDPNEPVKPQPEELVKIAEANSANEPEPTNAIIQTDEKTDKTETYLIGLTGADNLSDMLYINLDKKPKDFDSAMTMINNMNCGPGQKIVLVSVVSVFEPIRKLEETTL
ncbi:hypothetical protein [Spirosoma sp. 48-14]|nr:hypothetical protein [Spirosoma sp. 48-14]